MKKIIILLFFIISLPVFAGKGLVIVLNSPLYQEESSNSKIVQFIRKGEEIFIHDQHFTKPEYEYDPIKVQNFNQVDQSDFYFTIDKNGNEAYVPKKYIKLITVNKRDLRSPISYKEDPTEYRIPEPLPRDYPLLTKSRERGSMNVFMGAQEKVNYAYNSSIIREEQLLHRGIEIQYASKQKNDLSERAFFGVSFFAQFDDSSFDLLDGRSTTEIKRQYGLGPLVSYEYYRGDKWSHDLTGVIYLHSHIAYVRQIGIDEVNDEEREFSSYMITPKLELKSIYRDIYENTDLVMGSAINFILPHSLSKNAEADVTSFWNEAENDRVVYPANLNLSFFLGIQITM
jgi:hypothetical protein